MVRPPSMPIYRSDGVFRPRLPPARPAIGPSWPNRADAADCCCCGGMITAIDVYVGVSSSAAAAAIRPPTNVIPRMNHFREATISSISNSPGPRFSTPAESVPFPPFFCEGLSSVSAGTIVFYSRWDFLIGLRRLRIHGHEIQVRRLDLEQFVQHVAAGVVLGHEAPQFEDQTAGVAMAAETANHLNVPVHLDLRRHRAGEDLNLLIVVSLTPAHAGAASGRDATA